MRPKILCLHGSGTSAAIFRIQSRKLAALLEPHFDLVYLDGPLPCDPGPGVLPFFAGCDPYLKWLRDESPAEEADETQRQRAEDMLLAEVERRGPFAGVLGFSQGAKVGMYLARRLEEGVMTMTRMGEEGEGEGEGEGVGGKQPKLDGKAALKFVVAVCGTAPFQGGRGFRREGEEEEAAVLRTRAHEECLGRGVVRARSIHIIAERDPWKRESEALMEFFDAAWRKVVRFSGEHHMPASDAVNRRVVRMILEAYREG